MIRNVLTAVLALFLAVGTVFADEIKAVFVKVDGDKLTVKVDDKEKEFKIAKDAMMKTKKGDVPLADGLKNFKADTKLTVKTGDKDEVVGVMKEKK